MLASYSSIIACSMTSDSICNDPLGSKKDSGTEWSDESCALIHGPVTGVRMWHTPPDNLTKLWVRFSSFPHDDVIKWKHFPRYWPFGWGINRSPVNSPHKGQWRGALMFSSICAWINGSVNNREARDLRRHRAHYDVTVMGMEIVILVVNHPSSCLSAT